MLGLVEYTVGQADLMGYALQAETGIQQAMPFATRAEALNTARSYSQTYYQMYQREVLPGTLHAVANNAFDHYEQQLGFDVPDRDDAIDNIVQAQYTDRYYGATLSNRLKVNERRLLRNIVRTAAVGNGWEALGGVLTNPVPFGAQYNIDKRLMLASAVKTEQDVAKHVADEQEVRLIQWNTSGIHKTPDICDEYAVAVDKRVVRYIEENDLDIRPKGVYFAEELPAPPHPNCTCEYGLVTGHANPAHGIVRRSMSQFRSIVNRLRGKS